MSGGQQAAVDALRPSDIREWLDLMDPHNTVTGHHAELCLMAVRALVKERQEPAS